ncbi:MAG: hypothetical protein AAGB23_05320 [Pseudomonadota bacterium]
MKGRWFRFYAAAMRHPKVARLSDKDFRVWTELLSVAAENDGLIPCLSDLKHLLNRRLDHLSKAVDRLVNGGLIDPLEDGYEPHGWSENQYKSDSSTERVKKHRSKRNVSEAVTETPPDTETETEVTLANANGASAPPDKAFWDTAKTYLGGRNPGALIGRWCRDYGQRETARALTEAQVNRAVDPVPYVERILRKSKTDQWEYTGP